MNDDRQQQVEADLGHGGLGTPVRSSTSDATTGGVDAGGFVDDE